MKSLFIILFVVCFCTRRMCRKNPRGNRLQDFYDEIEVGMSKEEVSEIINGPNPEGKSFKVEPGKSGK